MIRRLYLALICMLSLASAAVAQEPQISFELDKDTVSVGQPLVLRIKVLVPTWMSKPPEFPTIEIPSLMVRLPERATGPISEKIDGETWSGVQRAYRLYPLAEGDFELPAGDVAITYAEPGKTDPIAFSAPLPKIKFTATVPGAAKDLSPPILAGGFTIEQKIEGAEELVVGDAITRTLTASIEGTTPVLIPRLAPDQDESALRSYPKDPVVTESENRGTLSGTRTEVITYVAQTDGTVVLPAVSFDWFNLESGKVETASVPEITLTVTGAPPVPPTPTEIAQMIGLAALVIALGWGVFRLLRPALAKWINTARANWRGSEQFAHRAVLSAIADQDLSAVMVKLAHWKTLAPDIPAGDFSAVETALAGIGAARYGAKTQASAANNWQQLHSAYTQLRAHLRGSKHQQAKHGTLPPLNP